MAEHLAERGHSVDVLTTCCPSFNDDWERNSLRAGVERRGNLTIRRFRTDKRDRRAFERVNAILLSLHTARLRRSISPVGYADAEAFCRNGINSATLYAYLASDGAHYDRVVFIPYMFGTTLYGLPLVADRAYLQPCLHREAYAFLPRVAQAFHAAKGLLFNSEGELAVAVSLYGPGIISKSFVVGEGIDPVGDVAMPERVGDFAPSSERYVLYVGRQDPAKNVPMLVAAFKAFRRNAPAARLKLVFAGERTSSYADPGAGIIDLGTVSEAEKAALLRYCRALVQPSVNESFSRVIYEAWMFARPVVVHAECPPTAEAVMRSGGGFIAGPSSEWEAVLSRIETASDGDLAGSGRSGKTFADDATQWRSVIARYEAAFVTSQVGPRNAAPDRFDNVPDVPLVSALSDGKTNLLYAGTIEALAPVEQLLVLFLHYLTMDREARLTIVASAASDPEAYDALLVEVRRLDLADRILVTRDLALTQLQAVYLSADVFISLDPTANSAHEIRDAMWFDVPVLALDTPSSRAIAGSAAVLVSEHSNLLAVAALAHMLVLDDALREPTIAAQRCLRALELIG